MKTKKVQITFIESILGSQPGDPELHKTFIASKAPDAASREEEIASMGVAEFVERQMTYFHRNKDGEPCFMDYQVRGFFKSAAKVVNDKTDTTLKKLTAFKKKVDLFVFVKGEDGSRFIPIKVPEGGKIGTLQRPLRAQTMQGERVSLANSEMLPAGCTATFIITVLDDSLMDYVTEWLNYGEYNGLGQWRNGGYGRFIWTEVEE